MEEKMFFRVVKAAFGQRRKTLNNALKSMGLEKEAVKTILEQSAIDGVRRGETLSLEEFAKIANAITAAAGTAAGE
jgi:16S rRNA (adenine1518-N6/adenine1519-N6)-dimethyltransferase